METKPPKNPRKVEQGKRLAKINKERREEFKRMKEEQARAENEEFEKVADEFQKWKEDSLTIQGKEEEKKETKTNIFIPIIASAVVGISAFLYYRKPKKEVRSPKVPSTRPKILSRFEKF